MLVFFLTQDSTGNVFSLPYNFSNTFFCLTYSIVRIQHITHTTQKTGINELFMPSVRLLVNRRLLAGKFFWGQMSYTEGLAVPPACLPLRDTEAGAPSSWVFNGVKSHLGHFVSLSENVT